MSTDVVKYAFIAGEISPALYGRSDLTKYDLGMALADNFFVDYRGGLSTRPGFEFCDFVRDTGVARFIPFQFSSDLSNTYGLLFGNNYVRFVQDGAYVLEDGVAVTDSTAEVITAPAHGYANGDWVKFEDIGASIDDRSFEIFDVTTDTFKAKVMPLAATFTTFPIDAVGTVFRVYEVVTTYTSAQLPNITYHQYRDLIRLTHEAHPVRNLTRMDHTDWELTAEPFAVATTPPVITSGAFSDVGTAQVIFAVTAVYADGSESTQSNLFLVDNGVNFTTEEGSVKIEWSAVPGALRYNVYRSVLSSSLDLDAGTELGYVGQATGTSFVDPNIIPAWTKKPPKPYNPFDPGVIISMDVLTGGATALLVEPVTIVDPTGTGFEGYAVTNGSAVTSIIVLNGGRDYSLPVVTVGASGATVDVEITALTGTYPRVNGIYQQRQIYASSISRPLTVWGSKPKLYRDFSSADPILASDAFEFDIDSPSVTPVRHMMTTRGGILLFTQEGIWILSGGSSQVLSPTNALAEPQTFNGVSALHPIRVGSDILFVEGRGFAVRLLSYNEISRVYSGADRSIMSNHLFGEEKQVTSWAYQESPYKVVWGVRSDGELLAFTIVQDEDVYAWTHGSTRGYFRDIVNIREGDSDRVYVLVERLVQGEYVQMFERMAPREFVRVEDAWCVDSGLSNVLPTPVGNLALAYDDEVLYGTAGTYVFDSGDIGKIVRCAGGRYEVVSLLTAQIAALKILDAPTMFLPQTDEQIIQIAEFGEWTMGEKFTSFSGLWHLEGETVSILADGNVFPQQVVTAGALTLPNAVSKATVGLPFKCVAKTLPMIVPNAGIEAKRKRIVGLAVRLDRARGLACGRSLDDLYEIRERTTEPYGHPILMSNGVKYQLLSSNWDVEGQTYIVQDYPLPATLLGLVSDIEVGDEPD